MEPPFYYVRDKGSRVAHHWDYDQDRSWRALCGHSYTDAIAWQGETRPSRVCRACQELLPLYEVRWWKQTAEETSAQCRHLAEELATARGRINQLQTKVDNQRRTLRRLQTPKAKQQKQGGPPPAKRDSRGFDPSLMQPDVAGRKSRASKVGNRFQVVSGGAPGLGKRA